MKRQHWKGATLSLIVQQRYMFLRDTMVMQKGAGLGLLKKDPTKEELPERQRDLNKQWAARENCKPLTGGETLTQSMNLGEAPKCG